ncbi:hypothetical protein NFD60_13485 (plasmid) [Staphylococcus epidermidis]|nr:hypothetical protein NFD60_13485 [Staphylococcus epidermidis]
MYPTFNNKDKVVVSKISKSLNHFKVWRCYCISSK